MKTESDLLDLMDGKEGRRPDFDGVTYDPAQDRERLKGQLYRVYALLLDGRWHTLPEIAERVEGSEAAVSARLRDLRKVKFGAHIVERRRRKEGRGLHEYRLRE